MLTMVRITILAVLADISALQRDDAGRGAGCFRIGRAISVDDWRADYFLFMQTIPAGGRVQAAFDALCG